MSPRIAGAAPVRRRLVRLGLAALCGVLAAAAALGVGEFVAAFTGTAGSPRIAVGGAQIEQAPVAVKEFAVREFGTHDKTVLLSGILVALLLLALVAGLLALRRLSLGVAVIGLLGVAGVVTAVTAPVAGEFAALPSVCAAIVGSVALVAMVRPLRRLSSAPSISDERDAGEISVVRQDRRTLLISGAAVAVFAGATATVGRRLQSSGSAAASRARVRIPVPADPAPPLPAGYRFPIEDLTPYVTANPDFYRVDTDLTLPQIPAEQWALTVHGMVDRPMRYSFADLLSLPLTERHLTLSCVSNEVGGPYVSTAKFVGVPLAELLRRAGVRSGAEQLLSTAADGMTIGTPTELVTDGRDALVALAMNDEPLPIEHGFPARLIVPGLFGYAANTKWVTDLNLTTFATRPYWVRRGYDRTGAARTGSRIDVPRAFATVRPGPVTVAGIAYAQHRGIGVVQVRVDSGPWQDAQLATSTGPDTWRQWRYTWQATPGLHQIRVRAADARGEFQPEARTPVFPSGATGWESIVVTVAG